MNINCTQKISEEAQKGYNFEEVVGPQLLVLCGSLRKASCQKGIVHELEKIKSIKFYDNMHFHVPDLGILPLMNEDIERLDSNFSLM